MDYADLVKFGANAIKEDFIDIIPGGVAGICLSDKKILFISDGLSKLTGYTNKDFNSSDMTDLYSKIIHADDIYILEQEFIKQIEEKGQVELECRLVKKDGSSIWITLYAGIMYSNKCGLYMTCLFLDNNSSKMATIEINRTRQEMDNLINTIPGGVAKLSVSDDFRIILASDGYYKMTGYTKEECHEAPIFDKGKNFILEEDIPEVMNGLEKLIKTEKPVCVEYRIRKKDGTIAWNSAYCSKLDIHDGTIFMEAVFIDITSSKDTEKRLVTLTNNIPGGVAHVVVDDNISLSYASDGFFQLSGYSYDEYMGGDIQGDWLYILYSEDRDMFFEKLMKFIESDKRCLSIEYRIVCKNGDIRWNSLNTAKTINIDGKTCLECIFTDITESKNIQKQLELAEERYRIISEQTQDIVFDWDMKTDSIYHSPVYEKKFGYSIPIENTLKYITQSDIIFEKDKKNLLSLVDTLRKGKPYAETEYRVKKITGEYLWCKIRATAIYDDLNNVNRAVGIISDIDGYKKETAFLEEKAKKDLLTGLLNKITTEEIVQSQLEKYNQGQRHVLYLIDIDNFKTINDYLGHAIGDAVLTEISSRIKTQFAEDVTIGRLGGDEFAVFIKNVNSDEEIYERAKSLSSLLRYSFQGREIDYKISGSIGIAIFPDHGNSFQELYEKADTALYLSKQKGKDCFSFYSNEEIKEIAHFNYMHKDNKIDSDMYSNMDFVQIMFDILYDTSDIEIAINVILDLLAKYYNVEHIYIYEDVINKNSFIKTFEHCSNPDLLFSYINPFYSHSSIEEYLSICNKECIFICTNINELPLTARKSLKDLNIASILQVPIFEENIFKGIIGFSESSDDRNWSDKEINDFILIARIISTFILRYKKKSKTSKVNLKSKLILDNIKLKNYVVDENYNLVHVSSDIIENISFSLFDKCYKKLWGKTNPCCDCPLSNIKNNGETVIFDSYNEENNIWYEITASSIKWIDESSKYLFTYHDITKYKK